MAVCGKHHINAQCWDSLPNSDRSEDGCDRCPACAFEQGYVDGISGRKPNFDKLLDDNPIYTHPRLKKWSGQQKNCRHAYRLGYDLGKKMYNGSLPQ